MSTLEVLIDSARRLPAARLSVLVDLANSLQRPVELEIDPNSDIVTKDFADDFSGRLLAYHALHEQKLTKKTFEYVFCSASRAAGRAAAITANSVFPGADIIVDEVAFSLKTEGAKSISESSMTISKLMEARWIRECQTPEEFAANVRSRVFEHLQAYSRIIVLRAFERSNHFEYQLVEIPLEVLRLVAHVQPVHFKPRSANGGTSARVVRGGTDLFTLVLDGSVEKITVSRLKVAHCSHHATWRVGRM